MTDEMHETERKLRQGVSHLAQCLPDAKERAWEDAVATIGAYVALAENERTRRKEAEEHLTVADRSAAAAANRAEVALSRAEQAERERDMAAGEALNLDIAWAAMKERAEKAEADNAALLDLIRRSGNGDGDGMCLWCGEGDPHWE